MMSQNKLLKENYIIEELESEDQLFMQFKDADTYQVNISLIEDITGIEIPKAIDSYTDTRNTKLVFEEIRDIFVFQCYTVLAYIDVKQLNKEEIRTGIDGKQWIISNRQKTGSSTTIPLLPKAIAILEKYKEHSLCKKNNVLLPVKSNQKMNEYLKEIATLCGIDDILTTHKARRTFGSTVTLNNGVPMHVVKEMLGHQSIKQTEEYALTEQATIGKEMSILEKKMSTKLKKEPSNALDLLKKY